MKYKEFCNIYYMSYLSVVVIVVQYFAQQYRVINLSGAHGDDHYRRGSLQAHDRA